MDALAVTPEEQQRPPTEDLEGKRRRRNVQLALVHVALALGILAWFVWAQVQRG
jgi:hypothetical protein